ncbi:D-amino acid dehydrogenase (EC [Olavius algarvensis associated proteobacterium Delta 3]|nr:D-amino acid dehydrogenase (EC [Olavius algarvensis associated proteobacterium Delta 3]CAB5170057.1 D-amino acid dehydrogenase (EC [Olavius algarvensis associated proteobacterium Delta 3]
MSSSNRAVIIGGGVIGGCTAYYLSRKGWDVTLVEKDQFGQGASWGNCGLVVPSHVLPLNTPGNLKSGLRWILQRDAPLYIQPTLNPRRIGWFMKFALRCRKKEVHRTTMARAALLQRALELYEDIIGREQMACDWKRQGALHVFRSAREFKKFREVDAVSRRFGMGAEIVHPPDLAAHEPALQSGLSGGWYDPFVARLRPDRFMTELKRVLIDFGVTISEKTIFYGFQKKSGKASAVMTSRGPVEGDKFLVATGAWTRLLHRELEIALPIEPGKGYSITMEPSPGLPRTPCFFEERRVVATNWESGFRIGSTMEFSGYNSFLNPVRINSLTRGVLPYLKNVPALRNGEAWYGWRPMTYDGLPVIDFLPKFTNVMVAAGHDTVGISMAPQTGRLVAELLSGEPPSVDPEPYSLSRF